ncbi:uncharacterized protein LOC106180408 isoform X2 [Lingula anatina]|uniref:Uncharacterized protein LOC106180408 isoform X2 n=1 Tax=Lingula anatina TaxID=7574 RepID=A0A1S3KBH3_LINAN|nr:uncharacterized protein LOC106180408 isoform X2 [Lingula anatina]|eukprot:XP_013419842.1 uncharacterized protein LOC106180408 isoform X2 [Lingula anatina]
MKSLVFALSFLGFLSVGTAIKCYVCNNGDPNCGETLAATADDPAYVQDCPNTNGCMKIDATHIGTGKRVIQRKCFYTTTAQNEKCDNYQQGDLKGSQCYCKSGDLCNTGSHVALNTLLLMAAAVTGMILKRVL